VGVGERRECIGGKGVDLRLRLLLRGVS
jgi:hypothetical protein